MPASSTRRPSASCVVHVYRARCSVSTSCPRISAGTKRPGVPSMKSARSIGMRTHPKMPPVPEVAFVLAPRQNHFFVELSEALRDEIENHGVATSFHAGAFPLPRPGLVYALMPPHEYFTLMHGRVGP